MRIENDDANKCIIFHPDPGMHSASCVLMHGLGDSAQGLSDLGQMFIKSFPHIKFILPTASEMSVTLNMGHKMNAWYDIIGLDDRASESCEGIMNSVHRVRQLLDNEGALGLPYSRLMLAGFSQGGAMSIYTGLQLPEATQKLGGILVMSGYLPGANSFCLTDGLCSTPVCHLHGEADPVVRLEWAKRTELGLRAKGVELYELRTYPGVQHSISMDMITAATEFIARVLPMDNTYW